MHTECLQVVYRSYTNRIRFRLGTLGIYLGDPPRALPGARFKVLADKRWLMCYKHENAWPAHLFAIEELSFSVFFQVCEAWAIIFVRRNPPQPSHLAKHRVWTAEPPRHQYLHTNYPAAQPIHRQASHRQSSPATAGHRLQVNLSFMPLLKL